MKYSSYISNLLTDPNIKKNIDPIVYYSIKTVYDPAFRIKNKYFSNALCKHLGVLNSSSNHVENPNDTFISLNNVNSTTMLMSLIFDVDDYVLDREDGYILPTLIKEYIFSNEDPKTSELLNSYKIHASNVELIYCLKLAENLPITIFNQRETSNFKEYFGMIQNRIKIFYNVWYSMNINKYNKNRLIQQMLKDSITIPNEEPHPSDNLNSHDLIREGSLNFEINQMVRQLTENKQELQNTSLLCFGSPILNKKLSFFINLIRKGPMEFEIDEIARQLSIIDHELLTSLNLLDYLENIKRDYLENFDNIDLREKQFKCYILMFIKMQENNSDKVKRIQDFIKLAYTCEVVHKNYQSCYTIISALSIIFSKNKYLLTSLENQYKNVYVRLEKELNYLNNSESTLTMVRTANIPYFSIILKGANDIKNKIRSEVNLFESENLEELRRFIFGISKLKRNKYNFFKVNPLYDFCKFGFLEIFKPKIWKLKALINFDRYFSWYSDNLNTMLDNIFNNYN